MRRVLDSVFKQLQRSVYPEGLNNKHERLCSSYESFCCNSIFDP